jgi:hypothetical protein
MLQDFHLHTLVSDGELEPLDLLRHAAARGVTDLSITDHDSLGAYLWGEGAVFGEAARLGLRLTVGIELDADLDGLEVHLLGLSVSLDDAALLAHLGRVRETRFERARREIGIVNDLLGAGSLSSEEVFRPGRQTLMKPHFIHPLLDKGRFATYEEANAWYKRNVKAGVEVPKPPVEAAIRLIHGAGGWTCLAHPGYYEKAGVPMAERLELLRDAGLDGVEADYPYHACSPQLFSVDGAAACVAEMQGAAARLGLRVTRGSDCHTSQDFDKVYGRLTG